DLGGIAVATVTSSGGDRTYKVVVKRLTSNVVEAYSNDNGTIHRRYVGYPIISVLMLLGMLPRDPSVEEALKGFNWNELNRKYKKYSLTRLHVLRIASKKTSPERINGFVATVMSKLKGLDVIFNEKLLNSIESPQ
nr:hypothetical protein [Desulfurococcales archaeon]